MTPSQNSLYWREWGRAVTFCKGHGLPAPVRHELHAKALGHDKSHLDLTNREFDQVLSEFRAISRPDDIGAQLRQQDMPRRRLLYSIMHLAPEPYWRSIARDKFGTDDESSLDLVQLRQLRLTLASRSGGFSNGENGNRFRFHQQPAL